MELDNFLPIYDRILVERSEAADMSPAGILYVPESAKQKTMKGTAVKVGPYRLLQDGKRKELAVFRNDTVFFNQYAGSEIELDGKPYIVLREDEVLGVVRP